MKRRNLCRFKQFFYLFTALLLLSFCGCVNSGRWAWEHPDKNSKRQLQYDKKACRNLAQAEGAKIDYFNEFYARDNVYFYVPSYRDKDYQKYLRRHNYDSFFQQQTDLGRFYLICMKAKGWRRVKVEVDGNQ